jgi:hypothetical protein
MNPIVVTTFIVAIIIAACAVVWFLAVITGNYRFNPKKETNVKQYVIGLLLFMLIAMMGCSPTASLPNGCKYKVYAPKFNK